jgi:hypothetical protein
MPVLFIHFLLKDAHSSSEYTAYNIRMSNEYYKEVDGSSRELIWGIIHVFTWRGWEKPRKLRLSRCSRGRDLDVGLPE